MARAGRVVVQAERLSDQVYELLREDLLMGHFGSGQRLVEVELAEKYRVSRTPVREALVQLARGGLIVENERGYATPAFSHADILHRLEVKRLLEPKMAEHVAIEATDQDLKKLEKTLERAAAAHAAGNVKAFNTANLETRKVYCSICRNELLVRCLMLADSQFDPARFKIHMVAENRERSLYFERALFEAVSAHDAKRAAQEVHTMLDFLDVYYSQHPPAEFG